MAQNFSSLVPRQKWQVERRNMRKGDVVLISYFGKCRPATYRLGVVVSVVVDEDKLVRTVKVEYSLLSDLSVADRLAYKGVTKKRITVAVQRLCLILPVEEREGISSPGGQAGGDPPDEVSEQHNHDHVVGVTVINVDGHGQQDDVGGLYDGDQGIGVASKQKDYVNNSMKSCHIMDAKVTYEDFEMGIYKAHSDNFDWRMVFGN